MTTDNGRKRLQGPPGKAEPKRKHAARIAQANAPVRTCIGCRVTALKSELVRMVESPEGQILFDLAGGSFGRGAWTHPTEECLRRTAKAMRNSRHKASPQPSSPEIDDLALLLSALADAANRRAKGLVSAAYRAGHLALGSDASAAEFAVGRARLVLLSTDARAASKENWLEAAVARGTVVVWASKAELGALVGREELAVFVVTDEGLARSLRQVLALTTPVTSRLAGATLAVARSAVTTMATGSHGLEDSEDG